MLIRSSDKTVVVNFNRIDCLQVEEIGNGYRIAAYNGESVTSLGEYSLREKAVDVLDEICNSYQYLRECQVTRAGVTQPGFVFCVSEE